MTRDTWHLTPDIWYMTCTMWYMTSGWRWASSQHFSSLALMVWEWRCSDDISTKDDWVSQLIMKVFVEQPWLHRVYQISDTKLQQFDNKISEINYTHQRIHTFYYFILFHIWEDNIIFLVGRVVGLPTSFLFLCATPVLCVYCYGRIIVAKVAIVGNYLCHPQCYVSTAMGGS